MHSCRRAITYVTTFAILVTSFWPQACEAGWPFNGSSQATTVERLAHAIDRLEKHLDQYGTVVAKSPDVWGEARLTKYRQEYEEQMESEKSAFNSTINASIARSDRAFVTNALALQAAVSGRQAFFGGRSAALQPPVTAQGGESSPQVNNVIMIPEPVKGDLTPTPSFASTADQAAAKFQFEKQTIALEPTIALDQRSRYLNHLHQLRRISDGDDKSDAPGYALHLVRIPVSVLPGKKTREGYGAEVTVIAKPHLHDKLLPETFRGLVINDLVDQWSFPLAKFLDLKTAEDTIYKAALPSIPEDTRETLAGLIERLDLNQQAIDVAITAVIKAPNEQNARAVYDTLAEAESTQHSLAITLKNAKIYTAHTKSVLQGIKIALCGVRVRYKEWSAAQSNTRQTIGMVAGVNSGIAQENISMMYHNVVETVQDMRKAGVIDKNIQHISSLGNINISSDQSAELIESAIEVLNKQDALTECDELCRGIQVAVNDIQSAIRGLGDVLNNELTTAIPAPALSTTPSRRAQQPFPITMAYNVFGGIEMAIVAQRFLPVKDGSRDKNAILLLDIQKVLAEEFNAAYDLLNSREDLWLHCSRSLADAVRRKDFGEIKALRDAFMVSIPHQEQLPEEISKLRTKPLLIGAIPEDIAPTPAGCLSPGQIHSKVLAWAIMVESALLNERLVEDMASLAAAKNAWQLQTEWLPYFGPNPPLEAVEAFKTYVCVRWPMHVLAIDPVTQDQNVADSFSQRRELQLALSLAFASGRIGAQNFTRMARQLSLDMDTIALNRTNVAFSHGNDTFGWRFYPRVQSPETKGNLHTFAETIFSGGPSRDAVLKKSRLEPGMRECTAVVVMPSFVPYVIFDTRVNWFKLSNPANRELDLRDGVGLSREITELRRLSQSCTRDAHLYRQDEVYRLKRAVDQLDRRLPLQTTYVQMPFENSLGGFEFFNTGTPDLAPELKGFYGEPGISQDHPTTLFLVGDHFSVHETKVIAGGREVEMKLLSRQVMQVTIGTGVTSLEKLVDVHVATPYGVSNHLDIPLLDKKPDAAQKTAQESISKAVADHLQQIHVHRFSWDKPEARVRIVKKDQCSEVKVCLIDDLAIKNVYPTAFNNYSIKQISAWVSTKGKAADAKPVKLKLPLRPLCMKDNKISSKRTCDDNLSCALGELLMEPQSGLPDDTAELHLEAYLEVEVSGITQIIKVENTLVLKVDLCKQGCVPPDGNAAATSVYASPVVKLNSQTDTSEGFLQIQSPQRTMRFGATQAASADSQRVGELPIFR